MEEVRHFSPAQSWRCWRLQKLTASGFVRAVVEAGKDADWIAYSAGKGGRAFCLASDSRRRARLLFEHGEVGGAAAPIVLIGEVEYSLDELALDDAVAWRMHLAGRRNAHQNDVEFIGALFSVLKL